MPLTQFMRTLYFSLIFVLLYGEMSSFVLFHLSGYILLSSQLLFALSIVCQINFILEKFSHVLFMSCTARE